MPMIMDALAGLGAAALLKKEDAMNVVPVRPKNSKKASIHHFVVTGGILTETARDILRSEEPTKAWDFLRTALVGADPAEMELLAQEILDGKKKLVGDSNKGISVKKDNAKAYVKDVQYIYAGRLREGGRWYRPAYSVKTFGPDDAHFALEKFGSVPTSLDKSRSLAFGMERARFYTRPTDKVYVVDEVCYIFEMTSEPPFWWKTHPKSAEEAIQQFTKEGRRIAETGWDAVPSEGEDEDSVFDENTSEGLKKRLAVAEDEEEEEEKRAQAYAKEVEKICRGVIEQAKDDYLTFNVCGTDLRVPRAPFLQWAFKRSKASYLAPPWTPVSPSGMKLPNDCQYHTDWILGAGLDLNKFYGSEEERAAFGVAVGELRKILNVNAMVLASGNMVEGVVGEDILVLDTLNPKYVPEVLNSKGVITEVGGQLAHLAIVSRENGIVMVCVPDARKLYTKGTRVRIDPENSRVRILLQKGDPDKSAIVALAEMDEEDGVPLP